MMSIMMWYYNATLASNIQTDRSTPCCCCALLDPKFPMERRLGIEIGPTVNLLTLDKEDEPGFLKIWQNDAAS